MNELVKFDKPQLPIYWECETSVKFVSETIFKWKTLSEDVAKELWIAREMLNSEKKRTASGTFVPMDKTWAEYCEEIGSSKQVVNRWLKQWFGQVHVSHNSGENEWYTPPSIVESARNAMGSIDLDPATSLKANENIKAEQIFTEADNGLEFEWSGNVWMNPPYSQPLIAEFSDKLVSELPNIKQAIVLVNNATETNWFQNMMQICDAVCFLKGRVKYLDYTGSPVNAPLQGQCVLYFGSDINKFYENFNSLGICLTKMN